MPDVDGFTVAAFYEPAAGESEIGGDFYDVFELTPARYAVVVGDVSGKGAEAAARTAMAKYMLRAFAIRNPKPSSVMFHLNNALAHDLEPDRFATLVYGELDVDASRFTLSRGGHPPPLVYRAAEDRVEVFEELQGTIIGAFEDQQYQQEVIHLGPGDVLLLYTDGLIETRNETGFYGRRRIEEGLRRYATKLPVEHLTTKIYEDAAEWGSVNDDTVVFALKRDPD
jgi:sigma-B regulation protein RsbU (phosphoserine phosphatase)